MKYDYITPVLREACLNPEAGVAVSVGSGQEDYREGGEYVW